MALRPTRRFRQGEQPGRNGGYPISCFLMGEFIGSGTVGNGCGLEIGQFLEHGDSIELEIEKIGILKNRVERQDP